MIRLWRRFSEFLGPGRLTALFLTWAVTGLFSLVLNVVDADWVVGVQTLLLLVFAGVSAGIIFSALDPFDRGRWIGILTPSFALVVLGTTVFRDQAALFMGLAFGWIVAAQFIFNPRGSMAYQKAVRAMRKSDYETATKELDQLVRQEPKNPGHYRFRGEIHRLAGKLAAAKRDYKRLIDLGGEDAPVGYNLLAEVHLQAGEYDEALAAGKRALALAPDQWVPVYNLGMIEDRLHLPRETLEHLDRAIELGVPDSRHRLLIHLYRARAWVRLHDETQARAAVDALRSERRALQEWNKLLKAPQAETLRAVLGADVEAAAALINGQIDATALGR